jgi:hypothetical protein
MIAKWWVKFDNGSATVTPYENLWPKNGLIPIVSGSEVFEAPTAEKLGAAIGRALQVAT